MSHFYWGVSLRAPWTSLIKAPLCPLMKSSEFRPWLLFTGLIIDKKSTKWKPVTQTRVVIDLIFYSYSYFPNRDVTNILFLHSFTGLGLHLYSRPHLYCLRNPHKMIYGWVLSSTSLVLHKIQEKRILETARLEKVTEILCLKVWEVECTVAQTVNLNHPIRLSLGSTDPK